MVETLPRLCIIICGIEEIYESISTVVMGPHGQSLAGTLESG